MAALPCVDEVAESCHHNEVMVFLRFRSTDCETVLVVSFLIFVLRVFRFIFITCFFFLSRSYPVFCLL